MQFNFFDIYLRFLNKEITLLLLYLLTAKELLLLNTLWSLYPKMKEGKFEFLLLVVGLLLLPMPRIQNPITMQALVILFPEWAPSIRSILQSEDTKALKKV